MTNILTRFNKCVESKQNPAVEHKAEELKSNKTIFLKLRNHHCNQEIDCGMVLEEFKCSISKELMT
ncbi:hypothetical protein PHJA_002514100 [Phtheirospermum japonicum]|nr:hypothetical protein PHJA_002514100 [Phtheirospermum japonicum]